MPGRSKFSAPRTTAVPSTRNNPTETQFDFRGLDTTSPYDLIEKGRTPFAKNFRLYADNEDGRQISVSSRKGPGEYANPIDEATNVSNVSTTGQAAGSVGIIMNWRAMPFTPTVTSRLTKLEINIRKGTGSGPVIVEIYNDNSNKPGDKIADSSLASAAILDTYSYVSARFIEAPNLTASTKYWIVLKVQDDGGDGYQVATNTSSALSLLSSAGLGGLMPTTYSLNFKTYIASSKKDKGMFRFTPQDGINKTLVVFDQTMYAVNDTNGTYAPIITGLSNQAVNYNFTSGDGKVFWVNGFDPLTTWNGTTTATNAEKISNGTFEVNTAGWSSAGGSGNTISRTTGDFHSGVASLSVAATSGIRSAVQNVTFTQFKEVTVSFWVKATAGNDIYAYMTGPNVNIGTPVTTTGAWQLVSYSYAPAVAGTSITIGSTSANFTLDDVSIKETGIEKIVNGNLPILFTIKMHKDRLAGVSASDRNKLVFSENPGNPSNAAVTAQWYYAWLSVSFIYVPAPRFGQPIVGIEPFQDVLKIFTTNKKYDLYGSDRGSYTLREAIGSEGAVSQQGILSDENNIFFISRNGLFLHNGSGDKLISEKIQSEFRRMTNKENATLAKWNRQIRFYYSVGGMSYNSEALLYHNDYEEWQHDTEVYVNRAVAFTDNNDDGRLIESSSFVGSIQNAEQNYSSLGKAIDFAYWTKYDSLGGPAQKKRLLKYFPLIQSIGQEFLVSVDMDKDQSDSPVQNEIMLAGGAAQWGSFNWGDGTLWGGATGFKPRKLRFPGFAYYWQMRLSRRGVNNPVFFFGVQYSYKAKRL